jgi:hypothetical protein
MLQFFVMASEFWFLCNGLDLYYSITNPFFSFSKRIWYYHVFVWSGALFFAASPFVLYPSWRDIYGFWFINPNINDSAVCWIKITWDNYAWPIWIYFFVPLLIMYFICLFSLVVAYMRLRRGVTKSFLPRMRLLLMNTVNLVTCMMYWLVFVIFYMLTFWSKNQFKASNEQPTNDQIFLVFASKGVSALIVWILLSHNSHLKLATGESDNNETVDANTALREEVLSFATAGIRSSARKGSELTPDRAVVSRRPQQHATNDADAFRELINPRFFARFVLGYTDDLRTLEELVANKERRVAANDHYTRETITLHGGASQGQSMVLVGGMSSSSWAAPPGSSLSSERFSQRPTVVTNEGSATSRSTSSASPYINNAVSGPNRSPKNFMERMSMSLFAPQVVTDYTNNGGANSMLRDSEAGLEMDTRTGGGAGAGVDDRRSSYMVETAADGSEQKGTSVPMFGLCTFFLLGFFLF